jgi:hypothetical protein
MAKPKSDAKLRTDLKELASQYPRYGYLVLHKLLKSEGLVKNKMILHLTAMMLLILDRIIQKIALQLRLLIINFKQLILS